MENITMILLLVLIVGGAVWAIVRAKKRGHACVGCPHAGECGKCKGK